MKKVLFLDIDGVLNSKKTLGVMGVHLSSDMVIKLNKIVKATDCDIVISSSWRSLFDLPTFQAMFFNQGMTRAHKLMDKTKSFAGPRGDEIQEYLDTHDYECYCILDDETDMLEHQKPFFVRTDWDKGLTEDDVTKVIKILGQSHKLCELCNGYGFYNFPDGQDEVGNTLYEITLCACRDGRRK